MSLKSIAAIQSDIILNKCIERLKGADPVTSKANLDESEKCHKPLAIVKTVGLIFFGMVEILIRAICILPTFIIQSVNKCTQIPNPKLERIFLDNIEAMIESLLVPIIILFGVIKGDSD